MCFIARIRIWLKCWTRIKVNPGPKSCLEHSYNCRKVCFLPGSTALRYLLIRREDHLVGNARIAPIARPGDAQHATRLRVQVDRGGRRDGRPAHQQAGTVGADPLPLGHGGEDHLPLLEVGEGVAEAAVAGGGEADESLAAGDSVAELDGVLERAVEPAAGGQPAQHVTPGHGQLPRLGLLRNKRPPFK
jgi:hypothetical protein